MFALAVEARLVNTSVKCKLQKATEQDPVLQILTTTVLIGWPEQKKQGASYNQRILELKRRKFLAQRNPAETPAHNRS